MWEEENGVFLNYNVKYNICVNRHGKVIVENTMRRIPLFLFIEASPSPKLMVDDLPDDIEVESHQFRFLCSTIHTNNHFKSIFYFEKKLYLIDDCNHKLQIFTKKYKNTMFKLLFII